MIEFQNQQTDLTQMDLRDVEVAFDGSTVTVTGEALLAGRRVDVAGEFPNVEPGFCLYLDDQGELTQEHSHAAVHVCWLAGDTLHVLRTVEA